MTSILKADTIQDAAGNNIINENANTITIGASGDTIIIPSGATITNNGTANSFGDPGLPGMDMWRVTADLTSNAQPITANWERVDTGNFAGIGTAFSAPSSGVWTFPSTGIWEITFSVVLTNSGGDTVANTAIQITTNNGSAWNIISLPQAGASSDFRATIAGQVVTDVTDTGQVKFKLDIDNLNGTTMKGNTDYNYTYVLMKKLGET
jgi:hypothetical protein